MAKRRREFSRKLATGRSKKHGSWTSVDKSSPDRRVRIGRLIGNIARDRIAEKSGIYNPMHDPTRRDLQIQIDSIYRRIVKLEEKVISNYASLSESLLDIDGSQSDLVDTIFDLLSNISIGNISEKSKVHRYFPVQIYLQDYEEDDEIEILESLETILKSLNAEMIVQKPLEISSLLIKGWAKTKDVLTSEELLERLDKLEQAAELKGIKKPQADVDHESAQAVKALNDATSDKKSAVIRIGSILFIKDNDMVCSTSLNKEQIEILESDPTLLFSPTECLKALRIGAPQTVISVPKIKKKGSD